MERNQKWDIQATLKEKVHATFFSKGNFWSVNQEAWQIFFVFKGSLLSQNNKNKQKHGDPVTWLKIPFVP